MLRLLFSDICLTGLREVKSRASTIFPLLREGTKNGSDTTSVGIKDRPKAAQAAVLLSSVETLLTEEELVDVFKSKDVSKAGSDCEDTVSLPTEAIAEGFDKIIEFC